MSASRRTPSKASKQRSAEVMRLRAKYADLYGKPPRGPCENDAQWLQQKLDEAARWRGRTLIMPPSPAQMGGFNMGKALLLALLCTPAVGVALTDLGDSTPRSVTTNPTVKDDLAGVKDEMRKMREEMQEKVGEMGEMRMKVDGLEKEVVDLKKASSFHSLRSVLPKPSFAFTALAAHHGTQLHVPATAFISPAPGLGGRFNYFSWAQDSSAAPLRRILPPFAAALRSGARCAPCPQQLRAPVRCTHPARCARHNFDVLGRVDTG